MTLTESYKALLGLSSEYDLDLAEFEPNDCSDQIEDLQKELGLLLHPDIKEFLSTGGDQLPYLLPDVIAFCEASSTLESLSNVGGTFGHSWIPISEDQGGECFCLDNDTGQIIRVVYQHTEWHTSVVAESLGAFFEYGVEAIKGAGGEPISGYVPAARNELKRVTPDRTRWRRQEANLPFGCPSCGQTGYFRVLADKAASSCEVIWERGVDSRNDSGEWLEVGAGSKLETNCSGCRAGLKISSHWEPGSGLQLQAEVLSKGTQEKPLPTSSLMATLKELEVMVSQRKFKDVLTRLESLMPELASHGREENFLFSKLKIHSLALTGPRVEALTAAPKWFADQLLGEIFKIASDFDYRQGSEELPQERVCRACFQQITSAPSSRFSRVVGPDCLLTEVKGSAIIDGKEFSVVAEVEVAENALIVNCLYVDSVVALDILGDIVSVFEPQRKRAAFKRAAKACEEAGLLEQALRLWQAVEQIASDEESKETCREFERQGLEVGRRAFVVAKEIERILG